MYETHRTVGIVTTKLRPFGCDDVVEDKGRTGVAGIIKGRADGSCRLVGLRADRNALLIIEATGLPYASRTHGKMQACGRDGHTAMLFFGL